MGSNDLLPTDFEDAKVAEDMRWLAQFSSELKPPVKIAYENWSFGDRISSIEHAWKIVQMAVSLVKYQCILIRASISDVY